MCFGLVGGTKGCPTFCSSDSLGSLGSSFGTACVGWGVCGGGRRGDFAGTGGYSSEKSWNDLGRVEAGCLISKGSLLAVGLPAGDAGR